MLETLENKQFGLVLIFSSVFIMVFAQLLFKSRLTAHGAIPITSLDLFPYIWQLAKDWTVWVGGTGLVVSALLWYSAVSRLPLSFVFPLAAMSYPIIFASSIIFLGESFSYVKLLGNTLIVSGVLIVSLFANS